MTYEDEVRVVAAAHIDEIRADLEQARHALRQHQGREADIVKQIGSLERLVELAGDVPDTGDSGERTLHVAMADVLKVMPGEMLRAGDLAFEINRRGLYRMRDGRPVEAQQIHARVGNYSAYFRREGTFIKLIKHPNEG